MESRYSSNVAPLYRGVARKAAQLPEARGGRVLAGCCPSFHVGLNGNLEISNFFVCASLHFRVVDQSELQVRIIALLCAEQHMDARAQ